MSTYKIYCYFNDKNIDYTAINTGVSMSYKHDDYLANDYVTREVAVGTDTVFYAKPRKGYAFYRWVYRIGSTTATQHVDTNQKFTYSSNEDIYIRAEAIRLWNIDYDGTTKKVRQTMSFNKYIGEATLCAYEIVFTRSGEVTIESSNSDISVRGYLTTGSTYKNDVPTSGIIAKDNESGAKNEFNIVHDVENGTAYYLWIRAQDANSSGYTEITIQPPPVQIFRPEIYKITELAKNKVRISFEVLKQDGDISPVANNARLVVQARAKGTQTWFNKRNFSRGNADSADINTDGFEKIIEEDQLVAGRTRTYAHYLTDVSVDNTGTYEFRIYAEGDYVNYSTSDYSDIFELTINGCFMWDNPKIQGEAYNLTAAEWNKFTEYINSIRRIYLLQDCDFTKVYKGSVFTKAIYNEAKNAIQDIQGYGGLIPSVESGEAVTAYILNKIVEELNAVPI